MNLPSLESCTISIIGLGYVGLPLAVEFAKNLDCKKNKKLNRKIIGFDININRLKDLKSGIDITNEIDQKDKYLFKKIKLTNDVNDLSESDVFRVTVPTPIDENNPYKMGRIEANRMD